MAVLKYLYIAETHPYIQTDLYSNSNSAKLGKEVFINKHEIRLEARRSVGKLHD